MTSLWRRLTWLSSRSRFSSAVDRHLWSLESPDERRPTKPIPEKSICGNFETFAHRHCTIALPHWWTSFESSALLLGILQITCMLSLIKHYGHCKIALLHYWTKVPQLRGWIPTYGSLVKEGKYSTEVAFALPTQRSQVQFPTLPNLFDVAEIYRQWHCLERVWTVQKINSWSNPSSDS